MIRSGFILLFLLHHLCVEANNNEVLLERGNEALAKKEFQVALDQYHEIEKNGFGGEGVYQNMALAYAGLHQDAFAILYLEKALKFDPFNKPIREQYANIMKRNSQIDNASDGSGTQQLNRFAGIFGLLTWIVLSTVCLLIMCVFMFLIYPVWTTHPKKLYPIIAFGILFLICMIGGFARHQDIYHNTGIIITKENTILRLAPDSISPEVTDLPLGSKVYFQEHMNGWWSVQTGYGDTGWIQITHGQRI